MSAAGEKVEIENPNSPGKVERVDAAKFGAMRSALLAVISADPPGSSVAELKAKLLPLLPGDLFPVGDKAGWWLKAVQLDLEAKRVIARAPGSPVRLYRL